MGHIRLILFMLCVSICNVCQASQIHIATVNNLAYYLDVDNYEVLSDNNYYMYISVDNIETKDICVLHIKTNREENLYIMTESLVYMHTGELVKYNKYEYGNYDDMSIVGKAIKILDGESILEEL